MQLLFVFLFTCFSCIYSKELSIINEKRTTIDFVLQALQDQSWEEDEEPCLNQMLLVLKNTQNYTVWATWIWNSMHNPTGIFYGSHYCLGNFDQCLQSPVLSDLQISTQYCLTEVTLTGQVSEKNDRSVFGSTENYVGTKTSIGRDLSKLVWGACLPAACKHESVAKILKTICSTNPITPKNPEITVEYCQKAGQKNEYSFGFYAFFVLIGTLVSTVVLSTYYLSKSDSKFGVIHDIACSFSLKRNWKSLIKSSNEEVGSLNVLKVYLAHLAVATHTTYFKTIGPISTGIKFDEFLLNTENPLLNSAKHIDINVDNFLMISGLLLIKGLMDKKKTPLVTLVHRYFRLITTFAVIMWYTTSVLIHSGNGPVWRRFVEKEQQYCADNWWLNLLMLNNYVNSENICLIVSWYLPCDYHLAIMGTILFVLWQKNKTLAKITTVTVSVLSIVIPGIITYSKKLPGIILFHDLEQIQDFRKNVVYLDPYIRSHNRAGPFLVGMAMGYIISVYKPEKHRKVLSKETSIILAVISNIITYRLLTASLSWTSLEYDYLSAAIYAMHSRTLWAFATCLLVAVVEYGEFDAFRKFTSWHGFTILSRLAYGVYLSHSLILMQYMYSRRNPQQFDISMISSEIIESSGILAVSTLFAFLLWMFVESPFNNLVSAFINSGPRNKSSKQRENQEDITYITEDNQTKNKIKDL